MSAIKLKAFVLGVLFGRWRPARTLTDGYSILMPMPMDMPFLLRFALEGLRDMDTTHCNQIVVIPDGWGKDGGREYQRVIRAFDDPRIELTSLPPEVHFLIHRIQKRRSNCTAANWSHWAMIVEGINCAAHKYAFLHDADAFFIDADGLERQYVECRDRGMVTLGVQYRADAFFSEIGYWIPGTWEMMYSVPWARSRSPITLKGQWQDSPHGWHEFDTMLYPQYLDYPTGKVGAMESPPRIVHFHGAVTTYRAFKDRKDESVGDDLFRLLLLAILEELVPGETTERILPSPIELARGLDEQSAPVRYNSSRAAREYPIFRRQVDELLEAPVFAGERSERIRGFIRPFDEHFATRSTVAAPLDDIATNPRRHGLS
jgi:hypothetical protein